MTSIEDDVLAYIRAEFVPPDQAARLTVTSPLITSTILNSLTTLQLVGFLEERFGISVAAHEANVQYLNTVEQIAALVRSKQGKGA